MERDKINIENITDLVKNIGNVQANIDPLKCGNLFYKYLENINNNTAEPSIKINNPNFISFYGIQVILDETMPPDLARIGNKFVRIIDNKQSKQ